MIESVIPTHAAFPLTTPIRRTTQLCRSGRGHTARHRAETLTLSVIGILAILCSIVSGCSTGPLSPSAAMTRSAIEVSEGDIEGAERTLRESLAAHPEQAAELRSKLGGFLFARGRYDEAIGQWQELLRAQPENADAHYNLGLTYLAQDKLKEAEGELREALTLNENHTAAHSDLGVLLDRKGDEGEAIASFERALAIDTTYAPANANLARAYARQRDFDLAALHYQAAINTNPALADPYLGLAVVYDLQQQPERSKKILMHGLQLPAVAAEIGVELADRALAENKTDEAISYLRQAIEANPRRSHPYARLALIQRAAGARADAAATVEDGLSELPHSAELWAIRGQLEFDQDRFDQARAHWDEALRYDRDQPRALTGQGILARRDHRERDALALLERAARSSEAGAETHFILGELYRAQGRQDDAILSWKRATDANPPFAPAYLRVAEALAKKGKRQEAVDAYRRYLELEQGSAAALKGKTPSTKELQNLISKELTAPDPGADAN